MSKTVISVENLSKQYDLGVIGTGTISRDLERWWARVRGKPDPYSRIGQKDAFELIGESILALDDVSFTVKQGEALGIIGRNGAGKSTLLKILSRVTAPTSGVVKVKGRIGSLLEVGTGFHPELTGRENVYLNGAILGMRKEEVTRKFDEIVDFSGVEKFIDTPVKRYSSGMYVRLAFAVAAHLDPEILIVDEVLAVGDAEFQKKCLGKMGDVAGEGRTVLFVSHNMAAIEGLCKLCFWFDKGRMKARGDSTEIIANYLLSSSTGFTSKVQSEELVFDGISNKDELNQLQITDDLILSLNFRSGQNEINDMGVDIALVNAKGEWILHLQSGLLTSGIDLKPNNKFCVNFSVKSPNLSPGQYQLIIFVTSGKERRVVLWLENIHACTVTPVVQSSWIKSNYIDKTRSAIFPKFTYSVSDYD